MVPAEKSVPTVADRRFDVWRRREALERERREQERHQAELLVAWDTQSEAEKEAIRRHVRATYPALAKRDDLSVLFRAACLRAMETMRTDR